MKTAQDIGSAKGDRAKRGSASSEQGSTFYDIFRFIGGGINEYIMNKYFILLLLMCFSHSIMGQTEERNDTVLQGRICDVVKIKLFPLINDSILKTNNYPIIFPLLIVNDVPIRDEKKVNCFRNHFDKTKIKRLKSISKAEADRKGIPNVPKDGVLFVTTKKGYNFNFSCE